MAILRPAGPVPTMQMSPSMWVLLGSRRASVCIRSVLGHLDGIQRALTRFGKGDHPAFDGRGATGGEIGFYLTNDLFGLVFVGVEVCGENVVELAFAVFGGGGGAVIRSDL